MSETRSKLQRVRSSDVCILHYMSYMCTSAFPGACACVFIRMCTIITCMATIMHGPWYSFLKLPLARQIIDTEKVTDII